ncbi:MAG: transporter [Bacteroidetes bacterium]|nr:transporter [Bacteroidota bacterium]
MAVASSKNGVSSILTAGVIVAALGYFVDIYDLLLFGVVRKDSLSSMGYSPAEIEKYGLMLLNVQMIGMLIGGIFWGMLGDKKGRLSVLFGSIVIYSIANIGNGFVNDVTQYAILRFIAGFGLAGELGAGITLVSESLPTEKRGYGTMIVAAVGVSGAVFAGIISRTIGNWRACYFLGGALGLALLILRVSVYESGLFKDMLQKPVQRGNFFMLFRSRAIFLKYLRCILIGLPTWFAIGILVFFSPEFARKDLLNIDGKVVAGDAIMYSYAGITLGNVLCSWLSQYLHSRRQAVFWFLILTAIGFVLYFTAYGRSVTYFYIAMVITGIGTGFWAVIITNAAEQFGTNIRSTVATTVPNLIRGSLNVITPIYAALQAYFNKLVSAEILAVVIIVIPLVALYYTQETFTKDLNYIEEI